MGQLKELIVRDIVAEEVHPGITNAEDLLAGILEIPGSTSSRIVLSSEFYSSIYINEAIPLDWHSYDVQARRLGLEAIQVTLTPNTHNNDPLRLYYVDTQGERGEKGSIVGVDITPDNPLVVTLTPEYRILPLLEGDKTPEHEDDHPTHWIHGFLLLEETPPPPPKREDIVVREPLARRQTENARNGVLH